MTKKSWQKLKYLENEKSFKDEIKSIFHNLIIFKGLLMKQITQFFLEGESPTLKRIKMAMAGNNGFSSTLIQ